MASNLSEIFNLINDQSVDYYVLNVHRDKVEFGEHQHNKSQLIYAEGGIVHIFLENQHWYLPARCFMIIPANARHSIIGHGHEVLMFNLYFKEEETTPECFSHPDVYFATDLIREMILYTKKWEGVIEADSLNGHFLLGLKSVISALSSHEIPYKIQSPYPKDEKLKQIAAYLSENMDKNFSLDEIAKKFGMSDRTLSRKFKVEMGMNYVRFLRSMRITRSLELIAENKYNMYEIAVLVGYNNLSSFSNVFYKIVNMRPTEYQSFIQKK